MSHADLVTHLETYLKTARRKSRYWPMSVPTIRLENYRDGLEDYASGRILEEAIHIKQRKGESLSQTDRQWLAPAKTVLEVFKELVASLTEYSRKPVHLSACRERLVALIETSQQRHLDPWVGGLLLVHPAHASAG